ncbi:hypothetical protein ACLOJK_036082 [Asimina triloba]
MSVVAIIDRGYYHGCGSIAGEEENTRGERKEWAKSTRLQVHVPVGGNNIGSQKGRGATTLAHKREEEKGT